MTTTEKQSRTSPPSSESPRPAHTRQHEHTHVVARVTVAMMNHDQSMLGRKGFIWLTPSHHSPALKELKQGGNLEAGADAEVIEGGCLLACSSWLVQPASL